MDEPGMNPKYGKKWFFFFTKDRPFLAGLSFFFPLLDFLCMNYGHKLSKGSNFCGKCGAPVYRG